MVVLASKSPRRKELLELAGIAFTVREPGIEEAIRAGEAPEEYVVRLAREKAAAVENAPEEYVLGADTVVLVEGGVLEKPRSAGEAERMLGRLSGREHIVMTGLCLRHEGREWSAVETTRVRFCAMSDEEVRSYVASGEPMDKAGAYAIQGLASKYIEGIEGCYFNVVGLPVGRVYRMLKAAGWSTPDPVQLRKI